MTSTGRPLPAEPRTQATATDRATQRVRARAIGLLFLAAMFTYGPGSGVVAMFLEAPDSLTRLAERPLLFTSGAALMLVNSAIVVGIGVLLHPVLRAGNQRVALGYVATRIIEGALLALGVVALLALVPIVDIAGGSVDVAAVSTLAIAVNDISYQVAMATLGLGSLFFCRLLHRSGLVPRPLAVWGFVGYAIFLAGAILELFGVPAGLVLSIPGGLFEVFFGGWLIARGVTNAQ